MAVAYKPIDQKLGLSSKGPVPPSAFVWAASTAYVLNQYVVNGAFLFRCSVAGTSAAANAVPRSSGPAPFFLTDNTVTWVLVGPVNEFAAVDAAAAQELGYQALGKDPTFGVGTFKYVKYTGTVNAGDFVIVDQSGSTAVQTPAAAPGAFKVSFLGIAMGSAVSGQFGWVMIQGVHDQANTITGGVVGTIVAGSATAGRGTSAAQTANYLFDSAVQRDAGQGTGAGTVEIYWGTCSGR